VLYLADTKTTGRGRLGYPPPMLRALALLLAVAGCSPCNQSLDDLYPAGRPSFSDASERARMRAAAGCGGSERRIEIGTCDTFQYVFEGDGTFAITMEYFASTGELVAAIHGAGAGDDNCLQVSGGDVPGCTPVATETLCPVP
jgi:hypothetical protein